MMEQFLFSEQWMHSLTLTLAHSLWQATLITVVAWLIGRRLAHVKAKYTCYMLALALITFSAMGTWCLVHTAQAEAFPVSILIQPEPELVGTSAETAGLHAAAPQESYGIYAQMKMQSTDWLLAHANHICWIWYAGFVLFALRALVGLAYTRYVHQTSMVYTGEQALQCQLEQLCKRLRINRNVAIRTSLTAQTPMTFGWLKPVVLFPVGVINQLSVQEVEIVLAHELAHISRQDWLFNLVQVFMETVFYYHPAVWWLSAQIRTTREHIADDVAIQNCGANPTTYARTLLRIQEWSLAQTQLQKPLALAFLGRNRQKHLLNRIQRLLIPTTQHKDNTMEKFIVTGIAVLFMAFCSIQATSWPQAQQAPISVLTDTRLPADMAAITSDDGFDFFGNRSGLLKCEQQLLPSGDLKLIMHTQSKAYRFEFGKATATLDGEAMESGKFYPLKGIHKDNDDFKGIYQDIIVEVKNSGIIWHRDNKELHKKLSDELYAARLGAADASAAHSVPIAPIAPIAHILTTPTTVSHNDYEGFQYFIGTFHDDHKLNQKLLPNGSLSVTLSTETKSYGFEFGKGSATLDGQAMQSGKFYPLKGLNRGNNYKGIYQDIVIEVQNGGIIWHRDNKELHKKLSDEIYAVGQDAAYADAEASAAHSEHQKAMADHDRSMQEHNRAMQQHNREVAAHERAQAAHELARERYEADSDERADRDAWRYVLQTLKKDGYDLKRFSIVITAESVEVNGKKLNAEKHQAYRSAYERGTGEPIAATTRAKMEVINND